MADRIEDEEGNIFGPVTHEALGHIDTVAPQGGRARANVYDNQGRLANTNVDTAVYPV